MLRGIGISNTIEQAADPTYETAEIRFDPLGGMTFVTGSISHGQGHNTIQTQMLVDRLGVDPERIKFIAGDTDAVAFGMGTGGSRSTTMSGGAIVAVSEKIIAKAKKLAAHLLEAAEGDVEFKDGRFTIVGTDRAMGIHEVAKSAFALDKVPAGMEPGLYETGNLSRPLRQFPERLPRLRGRDRSGNRRRQRLSATGWSTMSAPSSILCCSRARSWAVSRKVSARS